MVCKGSYSKRCDWKPPGSQGRKKTKNTKTKHALSLGWREHSRLFGEIVLPDSIFWNNSPEGQYRGTERCWKNP